MAQQALIKKMSVKRSKGRMRTWAPISLSKLATVLDCKILWGLKLLSTVEVSHCFAADLMSDVLASSKPGSVLLTGLTTIQSVHTADVADLKAIVYVSDKRPKDPVIELAKQKKIPLLTTHHTLFHACGLLFQAGVRTMSR